MAALATWAPEDAVLGVVAPLALAAAAGTCLVVHIGDLGPGPGGVTLAQLVHDGPRRVDLEPQRRGVAVLANGGIGTDEAAEVIEALARGWPAVVLACRTGLDRPDMTGLVPVVLDGLPVGIPRREPRVVQSTHRRTRNADPAVVVLPRASRQTIDTLLEGRLPGPSRWMRAWSRVWSMPWA